MWRDMPGDDSTIFCCSMFLLSVSDSNCSAVCRTGQRYCINVKSGDAQQRANLVILGADAVNAAINVRRHTLVHRVQQEVKFFCCVPPSRRFRSGQG